MLHLRQELEQRGFVNQFSSEDLFDLYDNGGQSFYCGFDPTADSLHLGNFVMFMSAVNYMKKGNKFYLILGGATGMIGDPSGKDADRAFLSQETLSHNIEAIYKQVKQILDNLEKISGYKFEFEIINNADFYKDMNFLDFLRDVGKYITVNSMMNKETVKRRIEDPDKSISYTEFSYMLIQGYDFVRLNQDYGVKLQICGSDQRGNGVTGLELIRKKLDVDAYVFTSPLVLDDSGKKFGKSEGNAIWLDAKKNSPYYVYQYFMNVSDNDVDRYLKLFTLLDFDQISDIVAKHLENPETRYGQTMLAKYVINTLFGENAMQQAEQISQVLFGNENKIDIIKSMNSQNIQALAEETGYIRLSEIEDNKILNICSKLGLSKSNGEARKLVQAGSIYINDKKVDDIQYQIKPEDFINSAILIRKGKKSFKVILQDTA